LQQTHDLPELTPNEVDFLNRIVFQLIWHKAALMRITHWPITEKK